MAFTRLGAILLALLNILACTQVGAEDSADCTGLVIDENGAPVAASQIKLEHSSGEAYRTETDGAGRFRVRNLPTGDYRAEVASKASSFSRTELLVSMWASTKSRLR
jgi:Carboxypeptidase regulatory-like domain